MKIIISKNFYNGDYGPGSIFGLVHIIKITHFSSTLTTKVDIVTGNTFKERKEYQVTEAYTSILAGSSVVLPSDFGEEYKYFVTFTMTNIPNDYWYHALDVELILDAKTQNNIHLTSNGTNEANIEGLMTSYYETYYECVLNGLRRVDVYILETPKD